MQSVVTDLAEVFRQKTGHTVTLTFAMSGIIREKLAASEPTDVIILNDYDIDELVGQGVAATGTLTDIDRTYLLLLQLHVRMPDKTYPFNCVLR